MSPENVFGRSLLVIAEPDNVKTPPEGSCVIAIETFAPSSSLALLVRFIVLLAPSSILKETGVTIGLSSTSLTVIDIVAGALLEFPSLATILKESLSA